MSDAVSAIFNDRAAAVVLDFYSSGLRPDPTQTIDEWADENRYLSRMGAAEPGRYRTSRTPYLRQIMRDLSPSSDVEIVSLMKASQIGGTEVANNLIGFHIHRAPVPIMMVQPSLNDAKKVSRQRIAPMIDATPVLRGLVSESKSRDGGNTILQKEFPGGLLLLTGANSDKGLRSTPACIIITDEIDAYPEDVAGQGDPVDLAARRADTFTRRKFFRLSTPTVEGISRIEQEFKLGSQSYYFVPCPFCRHFQKLEWRGIQFDQDEDGDLVPGSVRYVCEICGKSIQEDEHKIGMLEKGEWRDTKPDKEVRSYHINGLYSPWLTWKKAVETFLIAKQDRARLKTWVNTVLAETFTEDPTRVEEGPLMERAESFAGIVPFEAALLTAGVDVQEDRVEIVTVAWGDEFESWLMDWRSFLGNPADRSDSGPWAQLEDYLLTPWPHASGKDLKIAAVCIDSGFQTDSVYAFTRSRFARRVFPSKGSSEMGKPLVTKPRKHTSGRIFPAMIGTDTAKDAIYSRLKIVEPGAGYVHFSDKLDVEFYRQLTSEVVEKKRYRGRIRRRYVKKRHAKNEVLDCVVNNLAACALLNANVKKILENLRKFKPDPNREKAPEQPSEQKSPSVLSPPVPDKRKNPFTNARLPGAPRRGFVKRWKV